MGRRIVTENSAESPDSRRAYAGATGPTGITKANEEENMPEGIDIAVKASLSMIEKTTVPEGIPVKSEQQDDYLSMLIKYIPTEIVALYLFVDGILRSFDSSPFFGWAVFVLLLALTPIYIWRMTIIRLMPVAWDQIIVSFFSFALWVYAIGGPFATLPWYAPQYGSIMVAIFTVVVPIFKNNASKKKKAAQP